MKNEKNWQSDDFFSCGLGALTVNTPSPAALRRGTGRQTGWLVGRLVADEVDNSGVYQGGRADSIGRTGLVVCLLGCSLTLLISEEICGRFGLFRRTDVCMSRL